MAGVENPADLLTRGVTAEELIFSKVWLQGPKFLVERRSDEVELFEPSAVLCSVMAGEAASPVLIAATPGENVFQVERWGKLTKAIRVVAWVLRFRTMEPPVWRSQSLHFHNTIGNKCLPPTGIRLDP